MIIELNSGCGLCNRLRTIMYFYRILPSKEKLTVVWKYGKHLGVNGSFLNYFESLPNVEFTTSSLPGADYAGHGGDLPSHKKTGLYDDLKPIHSIREKITATQNFLGVDYVAVHIRRTDHINLAKRNFSFTQDSEFTNFLDHHSGKNIFIATDNVDTFEYFFSRYPDQIKFDRWHQFNSVKNGRRHTDLETSVLDLYLCIYASSFLGSGYSSFTDFINVNRR